MKTNSRNSLSLIMFILYTSKVIKILLMSVIILAVIGCSLESDNANSEYTELSKLYGSCVADLKQLENYMIEINPILTDKINTNVKKLKAIKKELSTYDRRFSHDQCGNVYKYIGVIDQDEVHNFIAVKLVINSVNDLIRYTILHKDNEDIVDIKARLGVSVDLLMDTIKNDKVKIS